MSHYASDYACRSKLKEVAGIRRYWRVPTIDEYRQAEKNGIRKALPNMNYWFWSSLKFLSKASYAKVFNGTDGDSSKQELRYEYMNSVRCVSESN